jgi:hypothetical protein
VKRSPLVAPLFFLFASALCLQAGTITDNVTVYGTSMPWMTTGGALCGLSSATNTTYFSYGLQDGTCPIVVNSSSGISFAPGGILTITYQSGLVTIDELNSSPSDNADGYAPGTPIPYLANAGPGTTGTYFPSLYLGTYYPLYLGALVGVFTDSAGDLVCPLGSPPCSDPVGFGLSPDSATPFSVSIQIPSGATQLQLGIDDDGFSDNAGSYSVLIQGPAAPVPEPASFLLISFPLLGLAAFKYRRSKSLPR